MQTNNPLYIDNDEKMMKFYPSILDNPKGNFVTRYLCQSDSKKFKVWVPNVLLNKFGAEYPEKILIGLSCSPFPIKHLGYLPQEDKPLHRDKDSWEFEFAKECSVVFQYVVSIKGEPPYKLFIPQSEFSKTPVPKRLMLSVHESNQITLDFLSI